MCSVSVVTVVFIYTMEDDQRLDTLVHESDALRFSVYHCKRSLKIAVFTILHSMLCLPSVRQLYMYIILPVCDNLLGVSRDEIQFSKHARTGSHGARHLFLPDMHDNSMFLQV